MEKNGSMQNTHVHIRTLLFLITFFMLGGSIRINAIGVSKNEINSTQQDATKVTGKVFDQSTKETLPGVSVIVKGTNTATMTDTDGNFTITVPFANALLTFSYLGFQPQEISLAGKKTLEIYLVEDTKALEEVVVVGYTTQKKMTITGAVSTITTRDLVQSPTANINNALAGRLPGLIVNQYSGGEPGVDKSEIFIRGKATYGDQSPIVIVDGVEREMSYISPEEIETFTILKDASSTAPFGIRGANGVVVITTKRGKAQDGATVNFKAAYGFNSPTKLPSLLGSGDYAMLYNEAMRNDNPGMTNLFTQDAIDKFRMAKGDNSDGLGYNWDYFDYIFKTGKQQDYTLSVRGGNDRARYYVMAGYFQQGGNYKHTDLGESDTQAVFKRYNFRSNIDVNITDKFWVRLDLGARITDRNAPGTSASRLMTLAMTQPPHLPITLAPNDNPANQAYILNNPQGLLFGDQLYRFNILGELSRTGYHNQKISSFDGSYSMGYDLDFITDGLKIEGLFSYDTKEEQWIYRDVETYSEGYREYPGYATFQPVDGRDVFMTPGFYDGAFKTGNKFDVDQTVRNRLTQSAPSNRTYFQFRLSYANIFNKLHEVAAMALLNRSSQSAYTTDRADVDYRYQGLTWQTTYNYDKRYLFEFNFGYNGSENFAKSKRFGFFPAASAGWVMSNEKFMDGTKSWLDHLKLRGSYGLVGSDKLPSGRFAYLPFFEGGDGYDFGTQYFNTNPGGIREGRLANPDLTWEKSRKTNIGIDASFLNQRLGIAFDVFNEFRYDIITNVGDDNKLGFPTIVGKGAPYINSGKVRNRGIDFEVTWSDKIGKDFRYFIKPNLTFARNKIVFMNEIPRENSWRTETGSRLYENFVYVFDHFVNNQEEADKLNGMNNGNGFQPWGKLIPGDVVYKDLDGDGKIDDLGDRTIMGNPRSPEIQFGIPITLQYKGFDISFLFQGAANTSVLLTDGSVWDFPQYDQDKLGKVRPMHLDRWTPETAETAKYPALHMGAHTNNKNNQSSLFLYDAKYIRLKNVEVGYNLPRNLLRKTGLKQVRLYAQAQNLITWDGLGDVDIDPEVGQTSGYWYPVLKVMNFGVDVTF